MRRQLLAVFITAALVGSVTRVAYSIFIPPGDTCNVSPCKVPNSKTVYFTDDIDLTGAVAFQIIINGNVAGQRNTSLADVTVYPLGTITFPIALGPGKYNVNIRTTTQYGWRDNDVLVLHIPQGAPRVLVPVP